MTNNMTSNNITDILLTTIQLMIDSQNSITLEEVRRLAKEKEAEDNLIEPVPILEPMEQIIPIEIKSYETVSTNLNITWPLTQKAAFYNRFNIEFTYDHSNSNQKYGFEIIMRGANGFTLLSWHSDEDVLGNPYFPNMIYKKSYDISDLQEIDQIIIKQYGTATLNNVKFSIGFDTTAYAAAGKEPLMIYSNTKELTYNQVGRVYDISLQWIYNINSDTFGAITPSAYDTEDKAKNALSLQHAKIYWYLYDKSWTAVDTYMGARWKRVGDEDGLIYCHTIDEQDMQELKLRIQAVLVQTLPGISEPTILKSNILEFNNVYEEPTNGTITNANIALTDDLNGNYYLYDYDNYLVQSEWYQSAKTRQARLNFDVTGKKAETMIGSFKKIIWRVPDNVKALEKGSWTKTSFPGYDAYEKTGGFTDEDLVLQYKISNHLEMEDEIPLSCELVLNDLRTFKGERLLKFAHKNFETQDYRVIIRLFNNNTIVKNQAYNPKGGSETVKILLFDPNGKEIILDSTQIETEQTSPYTKGTIKVDTKTTIEFRYAFPTSASEDYFYSGPTQVQYDASGTRPEFINTPCEILAYAGNVPGGRWKLDNANGLQTDIIGFNSSERLLLPKSSYLANMESAQVKLIYGNNIFVQPIIIYQDLHFSKIIDQWDGGLKISEEGNYILASAYVAGSKDENNKFTGAILGELGTISDNKNIHESGLFGYDTGVQSFGFKTDGHAFIGKAGGGRINFDGNGGTIQSGNYVYHITADRNGIGGLYLGTTNSGFTLYIDMSANALNSTEGTCKIYAAKSTLITTQWEYTFKINDSNQYELFQSGVQNAVPHWFTYDSTEHTFEFYSSVGLWYSNTQVVGSAETVDLDLNRGTNSDKFSISGTLIDLNQGLIRTPGFFLDTTGNVYMKGEIEAIKGKFSGFFISTSHLGDNENLGESNFALIGSSNIGYCGHQKWEMVADNEPISYIGTSPLIFYSGKKLNSASQLQDEVPFYITQSGFVKANDFYSKGAIVNEGSNYQAALREGQLRLHELTDNEVWRHINYSIQGIHYIERTAMYENSKPTHYTTRFVQAEFNTPSNVAAPVSLTLKTTEYRQLKVGTETEERASDKFQLIVSGDITASRDITANGDIIMPNTSKFNISRNRSDIIINTGDQTSVKVPLGTITINNNQDNSDNYNLYIYFASQDSASGTLICEKVGQ